jgi:ribosomal protein S2
MGWNLRPHDLKEGGVTEGAPVERWNRDMFLRFARPTEQDWAEVDPERAAEAVVRALEIVRAVASIGGTPAVVADTGPPHEFWLFSGIPTIDESTIREGLLAGLPPSEERLARLHEWPSRVHLNAEDYINAARIDLGRERTPSLRTSPSEFIEQPDIIVAIGGRVSSLLLAETKDLGIPLIAAVGPEADPTPFFWVIPGNFSHEPVLSDLIEAVRDTKGEGQSEFVAQLERYGQVEFVTPYVLRRDAEEIEPWLQERVASPQSSVDSDAVIAAWDH